MLNRTYNRGRPRAVAQIAKDAWKEHRRSSYTAPLAKALGLSKAAVSKWRQVPEDRLDEVAALLNISRSTLRPDLITIHTTFSVDDLYARSQSKENA